MILCTGFATDFEEILLLWPRSVLSLAHLIKELIIHVSYLLLSYSNRSRAIPLPTSVLSIAAQQFSLSERAVRIHWVKEHSSCAHDTLPYRCEFMRGPLLPLPNLLNWTFWYHCTAVSNQVLPYSIFVSAKFVSDPVQLLLSVAQRCCYSTGFFTSRVWGSSTCEILSIQAKTSCRLDF